MLGGMYAESGIIKEGHYDQDDKEENIVDIYVSAESLRVYENPWVEGMAPNIPGRMEVQHPVASKNSGKRNHVRASSVFLGVVCLLLLTGIICLWVQMGKDKTNWRRELAVLRKISEQLKLNNTQLSKERDALWKNCCERKPKKCKNLHRSENP
ncbi:hypothetical protein PAMP_020849 [Pampus punctatissimus]